MACPRLACNLPVRGRVSEPGGRTVEFLKATCRRGALAATLIAFSLAWVVITLTDMLKQ